MHHPKQLRPGLATRTTAGVLVALLVAATPSHIERDPLAEVDTRDVEVQLRSTPILIAAPSAQHVRLETTAGIVSASPLPGIGRFGFKGVPSGAAELIIDSPVFRPYRASVYIDESRTPLEEVHLVGAADVDVRVTETELGIPLVADAVSIRLLAADWFEPRKKTRAEIVLTEYNILIAAESPSLTLPPGTYLLSVSKCGFGRRFIKVDAAAGTAVPASVSVEMNLPGCLVGRVTGTEHGVPIRVSLYRPGEESNPALGYFLDGKRAEGVNIGRGWERASTAIESSGYYCLPSIDPGEYVVRAETIIASERKVWTAHHCQIAAGKSTTVDIRLD